MTIARTLRLLLPVLVLAAATTGTHAEVSGIAITSRHDVLAGKEWGAIGAYEKLDGTVHFAVDPNNPYNRAIPNIAKAPRDAKGLVEFSSAFTIITPKDRGKANGVAFFEANNRGHRSLLSSFSRASRDNGTEEEQYGDGSLLKDGFTLVWVGWQFSVAHDADLLTTDLPVATENGQPIPGRVSSFGIGPPWIVTKAGPTLTMDPDLSRYPPVDLDQPDATLTVAQGIYDAPRPIPRDQWQFAKLVSGKPVPDARTIYLKSGFVAGQRYDISYTAKATPVGGLGYAAVRDLASALKYGKDMPVDGQIRIYLRLVPDRTVPARISL